MREKNGGNIDSNCFARRKLLRKIRGEGKRKFVVIIWREGENRGKEREIRAVFAPRQAVYSSKLYLMFPVPVTLPCFLSSILYTDHAHSLHRCMRLANSPSSLSSAQLINQAIFPSSQQTNQSHFTVWQSFIL